METCFLCRRFLLCSWWLFKLKFLHIQKYKFPIKSRATIVSTFNFKNRNSSDSAVCSALTDVIYGAPDFTPVFREDYSIHTAGLPRPIQYYSTWFQYNLNSGNDPSDWSIEATDYLLKSGIV